MMIMKRLLLSMAGLLGAVLTLSAQVSVAEGRFRKGDDPAWSQAGFKDDDWQVLSLEKDWTLQGIGNPYGYAWYRIHVVIPSSLKKGVTDRILLDLGPIDDADETFLNGTLVGKTGSHPGDPAGFVGEWQTPRRYVVEPKLVRWDKDNVIAVRVYNGGDPGGFYARPVFVAKPELDDFVSLSMGRKDGQNQAVLHSRVPSRGHIKVVTKDVLLDEVVGERTWMTAVSPQTDVTIPVSMDGQQQVTVTYSDDRFGETLTATATAPYILTPPAPATPRYNGPLVFGVRPGSPVIFRLAFSGEKPMK